MVLWEIVTGGFATRGRLHPPVVPEQCPQTIADLISSCMKVGGTMGPSEWVSGTDSMPYHKTISNEVDRGASLLARHGPAQLRGAWSQERNQCCKKNRVTPETLLNPGRADYPVVQPTAREAILTPFSQRRKPDLTLTTNP